MFSAQSDYEKDKLKFLILLFLTTAFIASIILHDELPTKTVSGHYQRLIAQLNGFQSSHYWNLKKKKSVEIVASESEYFDKSYCFK